jgi:hypothetical protein
MRPSAGLALGLLLALLAGLALRGYVGTPAGSWLAGQVTDAHGPLAGATVRRKASPLRVFSDDRGRFRLAGGRRADRVTAWKDGYLIGGASAGGGPLSLRLRPLTAEDHEEYRWVDPRPRPGEEHNCGNCHGEIYREWSAGGHARAATGKRFRGLYEGTDWHGNAGVSWGVQREHPDGAGVCSSCHAPSVRDDDPAAFDLRRVTGVAAQGVHCDYCHKVAGVENISGLTHGRFNLRVLRPKEGQLFFGPLDDVDRGEDAYAPLYRDSKYCAACHEGVVFGVHVYSTYSEWRSSPAARQGLQCQGCHMAPTGWMSNIAPGRGGVERDPATLANHTFFRGGQAQMLRDCLRLAVRLERRASGLTARVRVWPEGVGHRVPTGYIDRQLLLVVEAFDAVGRPAAPRSGPTLPAPAGPELAGRAGRMYAKVLRDSDGNAPAPFWRAGVETADTRLTPGQADEAAFLFPRAATRLRVRLLHRRFWQTVARAKGWPDRDLIVLERTYRVP